jgi:hypothetical protein
MKTYGIGQVVALFVALLAAAANVRADWSDNFNGGLHAPPGGTWSWLGADTSGAAIANYAGTAVNNRIELLSPFSGRNLGLASGFVGSSTAANQHHYRNVRVSGSVGRIGLGNDNYAGIAARANNLDSYVLTIFPQDQAVALVKSRNAAPTAPITITQQVVPGFGSPNDDQNYYFVLDVLDVPTGAKLVGRLYDSPGGTLLNTIFGLDDLGDTSVAGAPLAPYYSAFFAQRNTSWAINAYFDDMSSKALSPGDANFSGTVTRADQAIVTARLGIVQNAVWDDGDFNGDGRINLIDLLTVRNRQTPPLPPAPPVGPPVAVADAIGVPEPSAMWLMVIGICGIAVVARRIPRDAGVAFRGCTPSDA